jgi:MFS transporter, DHA3 family, macrolide efflux protein
VNNETSTPTSTNKPAGMRDLLRIRNFRLLWLGQIVSDFGDSLAMLSLLILINQLTGSTAALATMLIVLTVPQITFGLVAGVYVDRLDRKRIMLLSDLLRGLLILGLIFVNSRDLLWLLYLIAFLQAAIGTFFTPARGALLPNIVPGTALLAANSISQTSRVVFGLLGTASAGVLIGVFGAFWPAFAIDALTFFVSFALISRIAAQTRSASPVASGSPRAIFGQLVDGLKVIAHSRMLAGTLVAAAFTMLGMGAVNVLFVPLIVNDLKMPVTWFGVLEFAQTASMVLSGSLVVALAARLKPTNIVSLGLVVVGVSIGLVSVANSIWHLLLILFAVGWVMTPLQASFSTIMQTSVDDSLRGRIGASLNTLISTASVVSMGLAGGLGEVIGVRNVFVVGGTVIVLAGLASALVFRASCAKAPNVAPSADKPQTAAGQMPLPAE